MNETREKPIFGQKNELRQRLEYINWALDEAQEAAETALQRTQQAREALGALMDEEGDVFMRVRCVSCKTSWIDQRTTPTVTHCPSCGKKQ